MTTTSDGNTDDGEEGDGEDNKNDNLSVSSSSSILCLPHQHDDDAYPPHR